jgi:hypothetical protein
VAKTLFVVVGVLAILLGVPSSFMAQPADISRGKWELNVGKSKMTPGPLPKSQTRTYEVKGSQVKSVQKGIDGSGKPTLVQYTANYDGKDKTVDDYTASFVQKKNGKVAMERESYQRMARQ